VLREMGYTCLGFDGEAEDDLRSAAPGHAGRPVAIVLGAEGPGLRDRTRSLCDRMLRIDAAGAFGSLNISNAAAVALYALRAAE